MSDIADYAAMTLEELLEEEKKIKKRETTTAVLIGFLVAPIVYGVAKDGFGFVYVVIPLLLIYWIYKNAQKDKQKLEAIRAEISSRGME
jgi:hypothetical protein